MSPQIEMTLIKFRQKHFVYIKNDMLQITAPDFDSVADM